MASGRRQKRMGPAPFASFEDLSDETETSPSEGPTRLPGINEDVTPTTTTLTPSAPRIDISRASSSSHHEDSRDSTPERELFQGEGAPKVLEAPGSRLGLAFREDGALELRSSTEELDFQDPAEQTHRASVTIISASSGGGEALHHQRKDSQGSEYGGLLSISGRTSRLSSIGSQGSRVSGQSRLSVTSGVSRSPSPHKMLLETSFCGSKADEDKTAGSTTQAGSMKIETEFLEKVLLSRKHDPTEAILAEGISIECRRKIQPSDILVQLSPVLQHTSQQQEPKSPVQSERPSQIPPEKPVRKSLPPKTPPPQVAAPVRPVQTDVIIKVDKPTDDIDDNDISVVGGPKPGKIILDSGVEYTFIPLKGPLPKETKPKTTFRSISPGSKSAGAISPLSNKAVRYNQSCSKSANVTPKAACKPIINNVSSSKQPGEPQYIRIKLKPDHMYSDEPQDSLAKPATLDLSTDLSNGNAPPVVRRSPRSPIQNTGSPSPSISRKSSFASIFRGKDYVTSPESPTVPASVRRKSRSRSKSNDRDRSSESAGASDKSSKQHRSVFTLFKSKKSHSKSKQSLGTETSPSRQTAISLHSLEFTFDRAPPPPAKKYFGSPLDGDTIIIPLHSPSSERPPPLALYAETPEGDKSIIVEQRPMELLPSEMESEHFREKEQVVTTSVVSHRQSSTSSENVVFSTNLGSDNEIFTTKLPKRQAASTAATVPAVQIPNGVLLNSDTVDDTAVVGEKPISQMKLSSSKVQIQEDVVQEIASSMIEIDIDTSEKAKTEDSSESENETLLRPTRNKRHEDDESGNEHERKGLVLQQDSFEDELPYVPTTLPLERSCAIPIVPIKQRATYEIKTCPIERPRSTTPINPSCLEDYCEEKTTPSFSGKLRISLPREDSLPSSSSGLEKFKDKSPRKWTEFVPSGSQSSHKTEPAPPLPPRGAPKDWINFEEIPERRKPPKRIQTIPSNKGSTILHSQATVDESNVVYSYVNPEDCKCECHEAIPKPVERPDEDEQPLLDRKSDSSPESQGVPPPPAKKKSTKPTNAFPNVVTTRSS